MDDAAHDVAQIDGLRDASAGIDAFQRRVAQFREIETSTAFFGLQQVRWSPVNIAATPQEALDRLFRFPGSRFSDPEMRPWDAGGSGTLSTFSWSA